MTILPTRVLVFGGHDLHQDVTPYYHVVIVCMKSLDVVSKLTIERNMDAIQLKKSIPRQRLKGFLEDTTAYLWKGQRYL